MIRYTLSNSSLTNRNVVVIVDHDEVSKLQVTSSTCSLASNAFHGTAISKEAVGMVVDQIEAGLVERSGHMCLSDGQTNSIRKTLTKGPRSHLNTRGILSFGVAWCDAVYRLSLKSRQQRREKETDSVSAHAKGLKVIQ